jgi:SanA protein
MKSGVGYKKSKFKNRMLKVLFRLFCVILILVIIALITSSWVINSQTDKYLFDDLSKIKPTKVGLVLGTSKYLSAGRLNQFFRNRIDATVGLYRSGKIEYVLVSGDNHFIEYNEPEMMKKELIKSGIPENRIFMDFAGFRTYDSVVRCYYIFGQSSFIIISQKFHNQRAVFIARYMGLDVEGYNAKDVELSGSFKTLVRECFARVKMFIDIFTDIKPRFLGSKIIIGSSKL